MAEKVNPIPEGFHTLTPYLVVRGVKEAIDFYTKAFGAKEVYVSMMPDGKTVMHCELSIGDSRLFLSDEFPQSGIIAPDEGQNPPVALHIYVDDVDGLFQRAVAAGAEVIFPLEDCFWGDRYAQLRDPFGHRWSIASRVENLTGEDIQKRAAEYFARQK